MRARTARQLAGIMLLLIASTVLTACGTSSGTPPPSPGGDSWDQLTWDEGRWA